MSKKLETVVRSYEQLGLPVGASPEEVRDTYRRLIRTWHPDVHRGDRERAEETSKSLNAAFHELKALEPATLEALRARSAAVARPAAKAEGRPRRSRRWRWPRRRSAPPPPPRPTTLPRRGRDIVGTVEVSSREALLGGRWQFALSTCRTCGGWGADPAEALEICSACRGLGADGLPVDGSLVRCASCRGRGCSVRSRCGACGGSGEGVRFVVRCRVPAGIPPGFLGVLDGLGHPGTGGGEAGDLYLAVVVQPPFASKWLLRGVQ